MAKPIPYVPWDYQKKSIKFLLEHDAAALLLSPGMGKTSIVYSAIRLLKQKGIFHGALVVAPLRPARNVWPAEKEKWTNFEGLSVVVLHGKNKDVLVREKHDVYVINYEGLAWLIESGNLLYLLRKNMVDTLVFDELSKMKHSNTARFKLMKPWLSKFTRRWGLTGSPAANGLMGLFGQAYVLDLGRALGIYITHYRFTFFIQVGTYGWRPKADAEEAIYDRLKPLALRMGSEDYLELPTQLDHVIRVDLPPPIRKLYSQMEDNLLAMADDKLITATNAAAARSKCRQIAGGAVYASETELDALLKTKRKSDDFTHLHDEKLDALEDLVEELQGQQLLIAYDFVHELHRLLKRFPDTPYLGGGVSGKDGDKIERDWNAGRLPMLFGHPQSIGHGLNLQGSNACHIAWYTLTDDFELYDQLNQRLRRQGNTADHVHVYHFIATNTVDEDVWVNLRRKEKGQKALFDALKERRR